MTHRLPGFIADRSNGDVATDSYHHYKQDVKLLKHVGVSKYLPVRNIFAMVFLHTVKYINALYKFIYIC